MNLISDFNSIPREIKDQPAFTFTKSWNKIDHFLTDEFPYIKASMVKYCSTYFSTLESCDSTGLPGSLTLCGDVKQSLYRWRGADPDNFVNLLTDQNPFK